MNQIEIKKMEKGVALVMVLMIAGLVSIIIGGFVFTVTSHGIFNRHSQKFDRSLWMAETGVQRMISGLKYNNDLVSWTMSTATPSPINSGGYWLYQWQSIKDENAKEIGLYRVEFIDKTNKKMRIKVIGKTYDYKKGGAEQSIKERTVGVELTRFTLGDFAIASNHQIGGAHINGGAKFHGGIFTAGRLQMDSSSTGIYNDYSGISDAQNFAGFPVPTESPDSEVFVFEDTVTSPSPDPNGAIDKAAQAELGTSTNPLKGIHTWQDDPVIDPGNGSDPDTIGDGIVGTGEDTNIYSATGKNHTLPQVNFPDASAGSQYMNERKTEAAANGGCDVNVGGTLTLVGGGGNKTLVGCNPANFTFDDSIDNLNVNGAIYITGNLVITGPITWTGKGAIFVQGNVNITNDFLPKVPANFPASAAVAVVATNNMDISEGTGSSAKAAGFFFGSNKIDIHKMKIYGNIFGNTVNLPTTGTRPDIYIHPDLMDNVGVPLPDFTNAFVKKTNWWEITGQAAKAKP